MTDIPSYDPSVGPLPSMRSTAVEGRKRPLESHQIWASVKVAVKDRSVAIFSRLLHYLDRQEMTADSIGQCNI